MKEKYKKLFVQTVWLFIIGAFFGYLLETIFYFIKHGEFINKQGLWFGPFKPIYGFGLLVIMLFFKRLKNKSPITIFINGVIIGTFFEYFASFFQEYFFNTYTWTYESFNLNLNGRIYLPYCFAWGAIAFVFIKYIYPYLAKLFTKFYSPQLFILTIILFIFMLFNITLTVLITIRYAKRVKGIAASSKIMQLIDKKVPDELIKQKFPKLRVID